MYGDTDATFRGLVAACASIGAECPLAADGSTASQIEAKIFKLMDDLKQNPVVYKKFVFDYSLFRGYLNIALYGPDTWQSFTRVIDGLIKGNSSAISVLQSADNAASAGERRYGIACGDTSARGRDEARKAIKEVMDISKVSGDIGVQFISQCAQWPFEAKERYTGPLEGVKTAHPVLLFQNRFDPVCSMGAAKNMTAVFEDAVLVEQNGFGVSSFPLPQEFLRESSLTSRVFLGWE